MANWCSTRIEIKNEKKEVIKKLEELIEDWTSEEKNNENRFGSKWLGNIVLNSGIGTVDTCKLTDFRCQGFIYDTDVYENELTIYTETEWSPMLKMWSAVVKKYAPGSKIIFEAEECGEALYATNDPALKGHYIIDCYNMPDLDYEYCASKKKVVETLQKLLKKPNVNSFKKLMDLFEDSEYSDKMSIHEWDICSLSTYD